MKKFLINIQFIFVTLFGITIYSQVSFAQSCKVPVCDIAAQITELKAMGQGSRFEYLSHLFASTKNVEDKESLSNLREFGIAAYKLTKEIDTEEWMFTSASQIANRSTEKLISKPPLKSKIFIEYYQSFIGDSQPASFSTLTYWNNLLNKNQITTQDELSELIEFAKVARETSQKLSHEIYVLNLATDIITTASNKFLQLDPFIEGVFSVKSECLSKSEQECTKFDTITIMLTDDLNGISVRFSEQNSTFINSTNFQFTKTEFIEGKTLQSTLDFKNNQNAHFSLSIDPVTKNIKGTFINSDYISEVRFSGKIKFSTQKVYSLTSSSQIKKNELVHIFNGELNLKSDPNHKVSAVIQSINEKLLASIRSPSLKIQFDSCEFFASKNVMTLLSTSNGMFIKLTLKATKNNKGQLSLAGYGFSFANSTSYNVELVQAN